MDYRTDGPGAWAVRTPIVVLAETRKHSREGQTIRADSERFPDAPAFAEYEQRALPIAQEITGEPVTTTIDFVLPNIRTEEDRSGKLWFSSRAT